MAITVCVCVYDMCNVVLLLLYIYDYYDNYNNNYVIGHYEQDANTYASWGVECMYNRQSQIY